jgi:hypothetical protein
MWNYCLILDSDRYWNCYEREMTRDEINIENYKLQQEEDYKYSKNQQFNS